MGPLEKEQEDSAGKLNEVRQTQAQVPASLPPPVIWGRFTAKSSLVQRE